MYPSDETQPWLPSYITAYVEPTPPKEDDEQEPAEQQKPEAPQPVIPSYLYDVFAYMGEDLTSLYPPQPTDGQSTGQASDSDSGGQGNTGASQAETLQKKTRKKQNQELKRQQPVAQITEKPGATVLRDIELDYAISPFEDKVFSYGPDCPIGRICSDLMAAERSATMADANVEPDTDDDNETVDRLAIVADVLIAFGAFAFDDPDALAKLTKRVTRLGGIGTGLAVVEVVSHTARGNRQEAADAAYIGLSAFVAGFFVGLLNPVAGVAAAIIAAKKAEEQLEAYHEYCATPGNCVDRMVGIRTLEDNIAAMYPHLKPASIPFTSKDETIRAIVYKHMPNASQEERDRSYWDLDHLYTLGQNGFSISHPSVQMRLFFIGRRGLHFSPEQARDILRGRFPQTENDIFVIDGISSREAQTGVIPTAGAQYDFDVPAAAMVADWMDTHNERVWMGGFAPNDYPYPYIYKDGEPIFPDEYQFAFDSDKGPAGALLIAALVERDTDPQILQEVADILVTDHRFNLGPIERDVIARRFQSSALTSSEEYIEQTLMKLEIVFNNQ